MSDKLVKVTEQADISLEINDALNQVISTFDHDAFEHEKHIKILQLLSNNPNTSWRKKHAAIFEREVPTSVKELSDNEVLNNIKHDIHSSQKNNNFRAALATALKELTNKDNCMSCDTILHTLEEAMEVCAPFPAYYATMLALVKAYQRNGLNLSFEELILRAQVSINEVIASYVASNEETNLFPGS